MAKNPHYFSQLAHIEVLTENLDTSVEFFRDVVGMDETGRTETSVYLRAWGDYFHHTLKLTQSETSGLGHLGWRADSPEALEEAVVYLDSIGAGLGWEEPDLGHGKAYRFKSPEGHIHEVFWDVEWLREEGERGEELFVARACRRADRRASGAPPRKRVPRALLWASRHGGRRRAGDRNDRAETPQRQVVSIQIKLFWTRVLRNWTRFPGNELLG